MNRQTSSSSRWIVVASSAGLTLAVMISALAVMISGCGDSGDSTRSTEPAQVVLEETAAVDELNDTVETSDVEGAAVGVTTEAADQGSLERGGLALDVGADGTLRLTGADQWCGRIDTAFESLEYLTNAIPVLKRSLTEDQGRALDALVEGLGAGEGAGKSASAESTSAVN